MADLDLERAKKLLKSAKVLYERGDMAGVAGLAYAAFESAIIALTKKKNGMDYPSHLLRRERAKVLLDKDEVEDGLNAVEKIIEEVEEVFS